MRWFRKDMRGLVKVALETLVKSSLVVRKPSAYGTRFSLNRHRIESIMSILDEYVEE